MVQNYNGIKKVVDEWAHAIRDGNQDGILARHTMDVVMFDVPMPLQNVGLEAYMKKRGNYSFSTPQEERAQSN